MKEMHGKQNNMNVSTNGSEGLGLGLATKVSILNQTKLLHCKDNLS